MFRAVFPSIIRSSELYIQQAFTLVTAQAYGNSKLFCHILIAVAGFDTLIRTDYGGDRFLHFIYTCSHIINDSTRNSAAYCYTQQASASNCTYRTLRGGKKNQQSESSHSKSTATAKNKTQLPRRFTLKRKKI
jgi:hypothetical protein